MATFQAFYQNLWRVVRAGTVFQAPQHQTLRQQVRSVSTPQLVAGGVVLAECMGFFSVGEILGRLKLVGYHGEPGLHH